MSHRKRSRSFLSIALAAALAPVLAFGATTLAPVVAQAAVDKANCRVSSVLAAKQEAPQRIPAELQFMADLLDGDDFAAYKSFKLLEQKDFRLVLGKDGEGKMRSGHKFGFRLLGGDDARLKLHATLLSKTGKQLLDTDYTIDDNGILIVVGGKHEDGKLIFAIQCKKA